MYRAQIKHPLLFQLLNYKDLLFLPFFYCHNFYILDRSRNVNVSVWALVLICHIVQTFY